MKPWIASLFTLLLALVLYNTAWGETGEVKLLKPISSATATQLYNPQNNTVAGNPNGEVTLVEFFDYNCPFCRATQPAIKQLLKKNPNLRVVYKEYLLFGDASIPAAAAALAANEQGKYLEMHQALLTAKHPLNHTEVLRIAQTLGLDTQALEQSMNSAAVKKQIAYNTGLATTLNLDTAPAFIVANTPTAKQPDTSSQPHYIFLGSQGAEKNLQQLIDKINYLAAS